MSPCFIPGCFFVFCCLGCFHWAQMQHMPISSDLGAGHKINYLEHTFMMHLTAMTSWNISNQVHENKKTNTIEIPLIPRGEVPTACTTLKYAFIFLISWTWHCWNGNIKTERNSGNVFSHLLWLYETRFFSQKKALSIHIASLVYLKNGQHVYRSKQMTIKTHDI